MSQLDPIVERFEYETKCQFTLEIRKETTTFIVNINGKKLHRTFSRKPQVELIEWFKTNLEEMNQEIFDNLAKQFEMHSLQSESEESSRSEYE